MQMETKVIFTEIIKPSSPTPKSLKKYQLSFIDQQCQTIFMPLVYFYTSNPKISNSEKSKHLKKSLSETLSTYHPFAGRLVGNLYVDCNEGGVPFSEAEANYSLSQVITNPNPETLTNFFPLKLSESQNVCMAVQVTYFRCGGLALGLLISHKFADAKSMITFANTWSAVARNGGLGGVPIPKFDSAAYFPPRDDIPDVNKEFVKEELATRFLKFPAAKISLLREMYSGERRPSRVEALSAYIWTRFLYATGMQSDPNITYCFMHPVNLRTWINDLPPSEYHFGNIFGMSIAVPAAGDGGVEVLRKIHGANKSAYDSLMAGLKEASENGKHSIQELLNQAYKTDKFISLTCTSLCGFPLYDVNFGWGEPIWVGTPGFHVKNVIIFTDAKSGGGIEVMICLTKQDMEKFEIDLELQSLLQSKL